MLTLTIPTNQVLSGGLTVKSTSNIQQMQEDDVFCRGILKPIRVAGPFHAVGIDYMGPMVTSKRANKFLLVATCLLTRWVKTRAVKTQTSSAAAAFFVEQIALRHVSSSRVGVGRGMPFLRFNTNKRCNITTTAYNP
ncbi:hypothetical protein BV898_12531 [Hypsibius exemplaris]|uniref:Uncharacterized protein n=1 Tax=Hypsibius exemplaris TaxID=2072580 RepID=A0A1W0WDG7_HYPEX|nr:hypothetical protein BV898_12531 [Hypsibius exemplaris]